MSAQIDRTILVVDDDEFCRFTLQDLLEHDGYNAIAASDGILAAKIVRQRIIDLVFLDVNMPGKNGIEVLREIKVINELLPVVITTANPDVDIFQWAIEAGAFSLLPKPFDVSQIRWTLQKILFDYNF